MSKGPVISKVSGLLGHNAWFWQNHAFRDHTIYIIHKIFKRSLVNKLYSKMIISSGKIAIQMKK